MQQLLPVVFFLLLLPAFARAQAVSINTDASNPDPSAILDMKSTDKGMLVPRMTTGQRIAIAAPATGLLVFDTKTGGFWFYNGTAWVDLSTPKKLADTDGDTKIQVEESPDEDIIRFDLAGTEEMVLRKNTNGAARLELPDATQNTFIGQEAGVNNNPVAGVSGEDNTFLGFQSGNANTDGLDNTFLGSQAGKNTTTGNYNTATGRSALFSNTTGLRNTATGQEALFSNTTGFNNTANGLLALYNNTTGNTNTAIGLQSLYSNTTGSINTANGYVSLRSNTSGSNNTANGAFTLYANTTGNYNTANGYTALHDNTIGQRNTATGYFALYDNTTGSYNSVNGAEALNNNTTGNHNTALGYRALYANTTGSYNSALGDSTNVSAGDLTNATAIGAKAYVGASNSLVLGSISGINGATSTVNVGIGTSTPAQRLEVAGNVFASGGDLYASGVNGVINAGGGIMNGNINIIADLNPTPLNAAGDEDLYIGGDLELGGQGYKPGGGVWVTPSDVRLKKDITPYTDGLAQVLQIKPCRFRYNDVFPIPDGGKAYVGVLAQDILQVAPYMVELKPFGQRVEEDADGNEHITEPGTPYYTYDGTALTYMLVNAVKEQQAEIEHLKGMVAENAAQKAEIEMLKIQLHHITAALKGAGIEVE